MKKLLFIAALAVMTATFGACEKSEKAKGTLTLAVTDAPIDTEGIESVYITVTGIEYNRNGEWIKAEEFVGPKTFNLLDLTRGVSEMMGSFELEAGQYNQIRFMLDIPNYGQANVSNPGCYIVFNDQTQAPLFVPSGGQTGYKAVGEFVVPINGEVSVTADFDVRKAVVKAGASGKYILKPTIRLIVDNQAGAIKGYVTNAPENANLVVYAYESGTYTEAELTQAETDAPLFPNAISSNGVDESGIYHIAFLAAGSYDLVIVLWSDDNVPTILTKVSNINVESKKTTITDIVL